MKKLVITAVGLAIASPGAANAEPMWQGSFIAPSSGTYGVGTSRTLTGHTLRRVPGAKVEANAPIAHYLDWQDNRPLVTVLMGRGADTSEISRELEIVLARLARDRGIKGYAVRDRDCRTMSGGNYVARCQVLFRQS